MEKVLKLLKNKMAYILLGLLILFQAVAIAHPVMEQSLHKRCRSRHTQSSCSTSTTSTKRISRYSRRTRDNQ
jgi:hypothetical protein